MSIGLCCQYIEKKVSSRGKVSYNNLFEEKTLQYGRYLQGKYPQQQIVDTWVFNVSKVKELLPQIYQQGIKSFRLSSGYFPLHEELSESLSQNIEVKNTLASIGEFAIKNNIRLTTHPDQWTVLSSKNPNVIEKARKSLAHHAWVMDCMNLPQTPYYSINIHGGVKGESKTLIEQVKSLPNNIKNRLTFENDERAYNVQDLYQVYQETGIPICLDTHHASFNDSGIEVDKALDLAISTWGDCKPLTHLSNTEPELINGSFTDRRKHSQYVHYIPSYQQMLNDSGKIDIDFEFKMKQLAIFKAVEDFNIKL